MKRPAATSARLAPLLPLLCMAALAGGTYWLLQASLPREAPSTAQAKRHVPDNFAENLSVTTLSESGLPKQRLTAVSMVRYEDSQITEVANPTLRNFDPGQPIVTVSARRGTISADRSVVDLFDDAKAVRAAAPDAPEMQALSDHFKILVNQDVVETQKPVKLLRGPSVTTASGMIYNNVTRQLQLLGQVRGSIAAGEFSGGARQPGTAAR